MVAFHDDRQVDADVLRLEITWSPQALSLPRPQNRQTYTPRPDEYIDAYILERFFGLIRAEVVSRDHIASLFGATICVALAITAIA